jgi:hypothetical protein
VIFGIVHDRRHLVHSSERPSDLSENIALEKISAPARFQFSGISRPRSYRTLRDGSLEGCFPRHFVPGYDHAVPLGRYPFSAKAWPCFRGALRWVFCNSCNFSENIAQESGVRPNAILFSEPSDALTH